MEKRGLKVSLLIFSGLPDPEWIIEENDMPLINELFKTIRDKETVDKPFLSKLGYRGFLVQNNSDFDEIPKEFIVYKGIVLDKPGPKELCWRDSAGIEKYLLAEARRRGYGDLLDEAGVKE